MATENGQRGRWISPITLRIMAVNLLALGILGGGLLYLDQFRSKIIDERVKELNTQSRIIAGALGEAATSGPNAADVDIEKARQILGRLLSDTDLRARLFTNDGELIADSRFMFLGRSVIAAELPPPDKPKTLRKMIYDQANIILDWISRRAPLEPYTERAPQKASDYEEVVEALRGNEKTVLRALDYQTVIVSVAVPVQSFRRVQGALLITAETRDLTRLLRQERGAIFEVFGLSVVVTMLMSIFLARTIARPIRRLSRAADRVRGGLGREVRLPDYAERSDEIGDLTRSISEMTNALYRQIDAVEGFAADVAHELKNPLSSMRSAIETVDRAKEEDVKQRLLAIVKEDIGRLDRLINDISDASRFDAEFSRAKMERVNLVPLLDTLADIYASTRQDGVAKVKWVKPKGSIFVRGLEDRLGQVVRNIIDNALSFTPADKQVTLSLSKKGHSAFIVIEDEGPGLPEQNVENIFKRFYSERPQGEAFGTHSGLGLSISRQIVEAHGGLIKPENKELNGQIVGARFIIELPLA
ncbi:MAG: stimulus-sensing domain-containing protein [Sphingomonadales bacterium]|jgi:two-component system sensor histidine kinase ChvG